MMSTPATLPLLETGQIARSSPRNIKLRELTVIPIPPVRDGGQPGAIPLCVGRDVGQPARRAPHYAHPAYLASLLWLQAAHRTLPHPAPWMVPTANPPVIDMVRFK